jgi:hypothetical protein
LPVSSSADDLRKEKTMRTTIAALALTVLTLSGVPAGAAEGAAGEMEVTKNPALLVSPSVQVGKLTVYGVKLGDSVEKIPGIAGVTRQPSDRPQDAVYTGRSVWYFASEGKVYQIKVLGEITKGMPPHDAIRLQMVLGKADEVTQTETGVTSLSYFTRHVHFTCRASKGVSSVDLYAP